ncbi:MAG: DUF6249 domain-containing protein [Steroidobacteraceae bacterium]
MEHIGPFHVAIAVFVFCAIATVAGVVGDYKKRQAAMGPLRAAVERGQPIDPAVIERLMAPEPRSGINPLSLRVAGIVVIASGIGVAILSVFLSQLAGTGVLYPVMGVGVVCICVGLGLMVAARTVERHRERQLPGHQIAEPHSTPGR